MTPQTNGTGNTNTAATAPSLTSSIPSDKATGIAVNSKIKLTFSEKMDTGSVTLTSDPNSDLGSAIWTVRSGQCDLGSAIWAVRSGQYKLGSTSWNAAGTQLNLDPPANLDANGTYTLSIAGKDVAGNLLAGNLLAGNNTVEFTTAAEAAPADTTGPTIISSNPDGGDPRPDIRAGIDDNTQLWFTTVAAPVRQFTLTAPVFGDGQLREGASAGSCDITAYSNPVSLATHRLEYQISSIRSRVR